jgi:stromal membrane-associated protein
MVNDHILAGPMASVDHRARVAALLSLPENGRCADCQAKDPRWASSKLGVFICTTCSGIHRDLSPHISSVRSCTFDSWKDEEAATMERVGNARANAYWEARLPPGTRPPSNDQGRMTMFIRQKYEFAKWADPEGRAPDLAPEGRRHHRRRVDPEPEPGRLAPLQQQRDAHWGRRAIGGLVQVQHTVVRKIDELFDGRRHEELPGDDWQGTKKKGAREVQDFGLDGDPLQVREGRPLFREMDVPPPTEEESHPASPPSVVGNLIDVSEPPPPPAKSQAVDLLDLFSTPPRPAPSLVAPMRSVLSSPAPRGVQQAPIWTPAATTPVRPVSSEPALMSFEPAAPTPMHFTSGIPAAPPPNVGFGRPPVSAARVLFSGASAGPPMGHQSQFSNIKPF